jgi:hypothetical protein
VQAETLRRTPPTVAWTLFKFTFHLRFVTLWAWLTRWPLIGVFPQNSHCCAISLLVSLAIAAEKTRGAYHRSKDLSKEEQLSSSFRTCPYGLSLCRKYGFAGSSP